MPVTAPSVPTVPPPSPRQLDRPIGQRYAHVYEVLRRPTRIGYWVRAGAPSLNKRLQARRPGVWKRIRLAVGVLAGSAAVVLVGVTVYSGHSLRSFADHQAMYTDLAEQVRALEIRSGGYPMTHASWRLSTTSVLGQSRTALDALGIRQVHADETVDALLFRPGGVGDELAYVHLGGGSEDRIGVHEAVLKRATFSQHATSWESLGSGWYQVMGRW